MHDSADAHWRGRAGFDWIRRPGMSDTVAHARSGICCAAPILHANNLRSACAPSTTTLTVATRHVEPIPSPLPATKLLPKAVAPAPSTTSPPTLVMLKTPELLLTAKMFPGWGSPWNSPNSSSWRRPVTTPQRMNCSTSSPERRMPADREGLGGGQIRHTHVAPGHACSDPMARCGSPPLSQAILYTVHQQHPHDAAAGACMPHPRGPCSGCRPPTP